jgi:hypothetical protein
MPVAIMDCKNSHVFHNVSYYCVRHSHWSSLAPFTMCPVIAFVTLIGAR